MGEHIAIEKPYKLLGMTGGGCGHKKLCFQSGFPCVVNPKRGRKVQYVWHAIKRHHFECNFFSPPISSVVKDTASKSLFFNEKNGTLQRCYDKNSKNCCCCGGFFFSVKAVVQILSLRWRDDRCCCPFFPLYKEKALLLRKKKNWKSHEYMKLSAPKKLPAAAGVQYDAAVFFPDFFFSLSFPFILPPRGYNWVKVICKVLRMKWLRNVWCSRWPKTNFLLLLTSSFAKKKPVDFDDELKIGDVRYDNMTNITIKVQLFWRLPYET